MSARPPIAPLISSSVAGPSGIMHLPRLWSKLLLHAHGRLPPDYRSGSGGFDDAICTHFGVDRDAWVTYVENERPDYRTAERWFLAHASDVSPERIAAFNAHIVETNFSNHETTRERRARFEIPDDQHLSAVSLNDLDDWAVFYDLLRSEA